MKIAIIGTGMVGQTIAAKLISLGHQVFMGTRKVVKTLNIVTAPVMVNPSAVAGGDHTMFVAGNDEGAKKQVTEILKNWFGWKDVIDLGDITQARGTEMLLPIWIRTWGALGTPLFGFKIAR